MIAVIDKKNSWGYKGTTRCSETTFRAVAFGPRSVCVTHGGGAATDSGATCRRQVSEPRRGRVRLPDGTDCDAAAFARYCQSGRRKGFRQGSREDNDLAGRLSERVALVTGAARGQGRAHAIRLAGEGADIIAVDLAGPLPPGAPYESATPDELA